METIAVQIASPPLSFEDAAEDSRARQIVEAAYHLLDESGLEGLTIRAVLARTGLARRAFYDNFSGKDDLVLAVFEQTIRLAADHYRRQVGGLAAPIERLRIIVTSISLGAASIDSVPDGGLGAGHRRSAALSREHMRLANTQPLKLQAALAPLLALIAECLHDGVAAGEMRPCDADLQATLIYNLVSTTVHTELIAEEAARPDRERRLRLAEVLWDFCRRAIVA